MKKIVQNLLPYLLVFVATIYRPLDPDLGWHLKYGEYFFKTGHILRENIFSTEMPNFVWANISWGVDLLYYLFYSAGGFSGLSLGAAFIVTLTFLFFSKAFKVSYYEKALIFPLLLIFIQPVNGTSFRGQLVSMMLLGVLTYLLMRFERGDRRVLFLVPLLFLLWANLHGLFLLGLGTFFLWEGLSVLSEYLKKRSYRDILPNLKLFVPVSILTIGATLIHPFGIEIYKDALSHATDPLVKRVTEYLAVTHLSQQWYSMIITGILAVIGTIVFYVKKEILLNLPKTGIFYVMYILSLSVRRYSWGMYYLAIPLMQPIAGFFKPDKAKDEFKLGTIFLLIALGLVLVIKYPYTQYSQFGWDQYCGVIIKCSPQATQALRKYYVEGKTYTTYNWGGYMIWNFPDMKPSTDGRMHLWRDESGYSGFAHDYRVEQGLDDIHDSKYDVVFTVRNKPIYRRFESLVKFGRWKMVYRDKRAAIFVRNERP